MKTNNIPTAVAIEKIAPNPNSIEYQEVSALVAQNDGYCCCALTHTPDVKCICEAFKAQKTNGMCHCGRFYKTYKRPVVTLCGSTRFKEDFLTVQKELTLKGYIVFSVGLFGHSGDNEVWENNMKEQLDDLHKSKIAMSDMIFVINKDGYIGSSTQSEIEWAQKLNK